MLHNVYLYGGLADKYGSEHVFDISNAPQAARALAANYKEFFNDFKDGLYQVVIGKTKEDGVSVDKDSLDYQIGNNKSVHIIPVAHGSKDRGVAGAVKTVVGVVLLTAGVVFGQPWLSNIGLAMVFGGVSTLLTPAPKIGSYDERESPDKRASFLFNGAVNRSVEGSTLPLVYGRVRTGSIVISAGINREQVVI